MLQYGEHMIIVNVYQIVSGTVMFIDEQRKLTRLRRGGFAWKGGTGYRIPATNRASPGGRDSTPLANNKYSNSDLTICYKLDNS